MSTIQYIDSKRAQLHHACLLSPFRHVAVQTTLPLSHQAAATLRHGGASSDVAQNLGQVSCTECTAQQNDFELTPTLKLDIMWCKHN